MKYKNFEDLPVWNAAIEFALGVFECTSTADFRGMGDLKNQIERAAVSISNNIAEGFERGTNNDLIHFLYISKGSAGECRSMLRICERSNKFSDLRSEVSKSDNARRKHLQTAKRLDRIAKKFRHQRRSVVK